VNKRLNFIESDSKYYVNSLTITNAHSPESIRRIARNATIHFLQIQLCGSNESHCEIYNLIPEMDFTLLNLDVVTFHHSEILGEIMEDIFFLALLRACKCLYIRQIEKITPEAIHQVYKDMTEGSMTLRILRIKGGLQLGAIVAFLKHIGIIYT
ncbi:hypothetical protein PENTCL1PPCAC_5300, partial [Pristionchus entomophagus]